MGNSALSKCLRGSSFSPKYLVKIRNPYGFHKENEQVILSETEFNLQKDNVELIKKIEDINELSIIK
jgi:hypothetical protein